MTRAVGFATFLGPALLLLGALPAQAGYRDLLREWEDYEAPAAVRPAPAPPGDAFPAPKEDPLRAELARLAEARAGWEAALAAPDPRLSFFAPHADRVQRLAPLSADPERAAAALAGDFPLEDLEVLALLRNPGAGAREREFRASLEAFGQVASLEALLRQYSVLTAGLMTGAGAMEDPDSPALAFPFPGLAALKGQIAGREAAAAWEALEAARRDAVTGARRAAWELGYLDRAGALTREMLDLLDQLRRAAAARYAAGDASFSEVLRAEIEVEKVREELATLAEERRNAEAEVGELLGLAPGTRVGTPILPEDRGAAPAPEALYPLARERRQELRRMRAMVGQMERMIEMAETMVYPRFHLDLSFYRRDEISRAGAGGAMGMGSGEPRAFPEATEAATGAGLPLRPWYGTQEAYLREARQRLAALEKELAMEEASAALRVREAWFALDRALREEALYADRVLPLTRAALEAAARGYSAGKVMFADALMSYGGWLEAQLARERRRADAGRARADLEAAVGTSGRTDDEGRRTNP
ncbi:MAG: TolC family protein [Thermodesulfobacteriota bacterium]